MVEGMRVLRVGVAVGLALSGSAFGLGFAGAEPSSSARAEAAEPAERAEADAGSDAGAACVKWWGETRATGTGYRHVVVLSNGCAKPALCDVSTDVNPEVQKVTVAPATIEEVVTFFDSPASAFTPNVTCKLK